MDTVSSPPSVAPQVETSEIEVRPYDGSLRDWLDAVSIPFGFRVTPEDLPLFESSMELDRALAAYAGDRIVGTANAFSFDLTIPGGTLSAAGVTMVGVHPTHRRRGILTRMMRAQLDEIRERGEPLAILWASEAPIYGRFGYGTASYRASFELPKARAAFRDAGAPRGSFRLVEADEAEGIFPDIYRRAVPTRAGAFTRSPGFWRTEFFHDPERWRRGGGPAFFLLHETDGTADGYARYRLHADWDERGPKAVIDIFEALATTPAAERELWQYLFAVDLTETARAHNIPVDAPLRFWLADPRALGLTVSDALWLRIVDLPAALAGRGYAADDRLVLEVTDPFCDWNSGRWLLEARGEDVRVTRSELTADLEMKINELGSVYLGGTSFAELALAERIAERSPGAVRRADALFRTSLAPWAPGMF
jgi:predicted acetyltransferase